MKNTMMIIQDLVKARSIVMTCASQVHREHIHPQSINLDQVGFSLQAAGDILDELVKHFDNQQD